MTGTPIRLLLVEDDPADAKLLLLELHQAGFDPDATRVDTEPDFLAALLRTPDLILCDYNLPQFDARRALELRGEYGPSVPFLIVSGSIGEEVAVDMMKRGATDFLLKDRLGRLGRAVEQALEQRRLRDAESRAQDALRASEAFARAVLDSMAAHIAVLDPAGRIMAVNESWRAFAAGNGGADGLAGRTGVGADYLAVCDASAKCDANAAAAAVLIRKVLAGEADPATVEYPCHSPTERRWYLLSVSPLGSGGCVVAHVSITARKEAEDARWHEHTLLECQTRASPDGILVVGPGNRVLSYNRRFLKLWDIPPDLAAAGDDGPVLTLARARVVDPDTFGARVAAIYADPDVQSHDEVALADGRTLDRYSGPIRTAGGELLGRVWYFRDITDRKQNEAERDRQRRELQFIFDAVPALIFYKDRDHRLLRVNRELVRLVGLPQASIEGHTDAELGSPHADRYAHDEAEVMTTGMPKRGVIEPLVTATGIRWLQTDKFPHRDEYGRIVGVIGFSLDVTEQRRAEQTLRDRERLLATVTGAARVGLVVVDERYKYLFANEAYADIFGLIVHDVVGRQMPDLLAAVWTQIQPQLDRALAGERVVFELLLPSIGGSAPRWFRAMYEPESDAAGNPTVVVVVMDVSEQKRSEAVLRQAQQRLTHVLASSPAVLFTLSTERDEVRGISWISDNLQEVLGYPAAAAADPNWWAGNIHPDDRDRVIAQTQTDLFAHGRTSHEYRFRHRDGTYRWTRGEIRLVRSVMGDPAEAVGAWSDITERKQIEEQFRQSQKMEAFGQLAGGVAHDFNNLLTIINGYSEMMLDLVPSADPSRESLTAIRDAGERASGLTAQLLAFSRKAIIEPKILDLNKVAESSARMLRRLIGEDVRLVTLLAPDLARVRIDPGQLEQILMNLVVNARDAMPRGGALTIATVNLHLPVGAPADSGTCLPGHYVQLSVTDTGSGMTDEVKARIFEPFFTTKGVGKGTGLGLATVFGIVQQAEGAISVESQVGRGTSFRVLIPVVRETTTTAEVGATAGVPRGTETILLVEDEAALRRFARLSLERQGYAVADASSGEDAVGIAASYPGTVHLLLTDVIMPGLGVQEAAGRIRALHPNIRVLYMSGYTDDAIVRHGIETSVEAFLQKPFTPLSLARKVREVLDQ